MNEALTKADTLAADEKATTDELNSCVKALDAQYKALRTLPRNLYRHPRYPLPLSSRPTQVCPQAAAALP